MTHAVVEDGEAEEVLDLRTDPARVGQEPHGGPGKHIHKSQDREQEGSRVFIHAHVFGVGGEEDYGREEAQEHDDIA